MEVSPSSGGRVAFRDVMGSVTTSGLNFRGLRARRARAILAPPANLVSFERFPGNLSNVFP
jgi:hypothetical protein